MVLPNTHNAMLGNYERTQNMSTSKEQSAKTQKEQTVKQAIANLDKGKVDIAALKARSGKRGGAYKGSRVVINVDAFLTFFDSIPLEPRLALIEALDRQQTDGVSPLFADLNAWWIKSDNYDTTGINGYVQDMYEFMPTYYKPSGATKMMLKRHTNPNIVNCVSFVRA